MRCSLVLVAAAALLAASCGGSETTEATFLIEGQPHSPEQPVTGFTASGQAVEEGMLCETGDLTWTQTLHADTGLPETPEDPPRDGEVLWVDFEVSCGDGTGDFLLRVDATVDFAELDSIVETAAMSTDHPFAMLEGKGDYADVTADGMRSWSFETAGDFESYYDVFSGTMRRG